MMTTPAAILHGGVWPEEMEKRLLGGGGISFEAPPKHSVPNGKANALLVILEPHQNPKEMAEAFLGALNGEEKP